MVFQSYALYPHMSVAQNMEYGLKLRGMPKGERAAKLTEEARLLDFENELDRKPRALSGGQGQRVAMPRDRARARRVPDGEPPARLGTTMLYITHDQVGAMTMGHRVAVLRDARLQQVDTPRNFYERPANVFVCRLHRLAGHEPPPGMALVEELGADAYIYGLLAGDPAATKPWVVRCDGRDATRRASAIASASPCAPPRHTCSIAPPACASIE
jgi:hypothetical protein